MTNQVKVELTDQDGSSWTIETTAEAVESFLQGR